MLPAERDQCVGDPVQGWVVYPVGPCFREKCGRINAFKHLRENQDISLFHGFCAKIGFIADICPAEIPAGKHQDGAPGENAGETEIHRDAADNDRCINIILRIHDERR